MNDTGNFLTVSIDHLVLEIYQEKGTEYVSYRRIDKDGLSNPGLDFTKGDKLAGARVLNQIAELIGYGKVAEITDDKNG